MKLSSFSGALPIVIFALMRSPPGAARDPETKRYIVRYANEAGHDAAHSEADRVHHELGPQKAVAATIKNPQAFKALAENPNVVSIEVDPPRYPLGFNKAVRGDEGAGASSRDGVPSSPQEVRRRLAQRTPYGIGMVQADPANGGLAPGTWDPMICIIDDGYDWGHEDLSDDATVVTGTNDPGGTGDWSFVDGQSHGTHVAGTIAALQNDRGVVGVYPGARLHIIKVFNARGWAYSSDLVAALNECEAAATGNLVVNMSLGSPVNSETEEIGFEEAYDRGVLSIAAAGNDGNTERGSWREYPASYDSVVSVAAIDRFTAAADFSQKNRQVELSAPGVLVESTVLNNQYAAGSGTSMAAPHVSGVAALVWSHHPTLSNEEIRDALAATAMDLGIKGRDIAYGHGLVQAVAAHDYLDRHSTTTTTRRSKGKKKSKSKTKPKGRKRKHKKGYAMST